MSNAYGPQLAYSDQLHAEKYRGPDEDFREAVNRFSNALKDDDAHFRKFRGICLDMRFMPAGRIQAAMGSLRATTPYNCFVSGTIDDSFVEGEGSIMARACQAAATMRMGGGIGYDFSTLRPRGDLIASLMSRSSGAVSFMHIYDAVGLATCSAGHRRGAQMGVLRIDHPDVEEFIRAKQNSDKLRGFNISLGVTDEFMECLASGRPFPLRWGGRTYRSVDASALWEMVMRSTWDWAEPGVLFIDTINRLNNLHYCETLAATNPCGEQPLPPFGACLLGSFNLVRYVLPCGSGWDFDWDLLAEDVSPVVRAMDNVVDRARYPLREQQKEAHAKRRMGLGVTGLANAAEALGYPYGSAEFLNFERRVLETIRDRAYLASTEVASRKGPFPMFDRERYLGGEFVRGLPDEVRHQIGKHGIRNSHLTSIAPTGTISMCADNVTSGLEPVFSYRMERDVNAADGMHKLVIEDYGFRVFGVRGKRSEEVTADEHVSVLAAAQPFVDSAISKTCNVSPAMPWDDFKRLYQRGWELGCKGLTTYNPGGRRGGVIVSADDDKAKQPSDGTAPIGPDVEEGSACVLLPGGGKSCE